MEFKTCEEKVLWDLSQAEDKVATLSEEVEKLRKGVEYANSVVGLCQQMIWMEAVESQDPEGGYEAYKIMSKLGALYELDEANGTDEAQIIATLKPLFFKAEGAGTREIDPLCEQDHAEEADQDTQTVDKKKTD